MGTDSKIQWCHHTQNFWIGCAKVSPACENCYAEVETYPRVQRAAGRELWGLKGERHITAASNWRKPYAWDKAARAAGARHRVFVNSLSDFFEAREDLRVPRIRAWDVIAECTNLDWLLLTKRPENIESMLPLSWCNGKPWSHVWLGTTTEDQRRADERIPHLLRVPAAVRFLSCEPLLEAISFRPRASSTAEMLQLLDMGVADKPDMLGGINWVIVGGESGQGARPFHVDWARSILGQCHAAGVPVFVKQVGSVWARANRMNGYDDPKGGDVERWPSELRVREFPKTEAR